MKDPVIAYRWRVGECQNYVGGEHLEWWLEQTEMNRDLLEPMTWRDFSREALDYRNEIERLKKVLRNIAVPSSGIDFGDGYLGVAREYERQAKEALEIGAGEMAHNVKSEREMI